MCTDQVMGILMYIDTESHVGSHLYLSQGRRQECSAGTPGPKWRITECEECRFVDVHMH